MKSMNISGSSVVWATYFLIMFEMLYMAAPFAIYFYSVYEMPLRYLSEGALTGKLVQTVFPHFVESSSMLIKAAIFSGWLLMGIGVLIFLIGFIQIYWSKFNKKGAVTNGIYKYIRHPQYLAWMVFGLGMALVWSRLIVWVMYVSMLFVYYFLAKREEEECLKKYPHTYSPYFEATGMFFLKKGNRSKPFFTLPKDGIKRYLVITVLYVISIITTFMVGLAIRTYTFTTLSTLELDNLQAVSLTLMENKDMERIMAIALSDKEISEVMESKFNKETDKILVYIMPSEWDISEIGVEADNEIYQSGREPLLNPVSHGNKKNTDNTRYKLLFSKAVINVRNIDENILAHTVNQQPKMLIYIDVMEHKVLEVKVPETSRYGNIPVPLF